MSGLFQQSQDRGLFARGVNLLGFLFSIAKEPAELLVDRVDEDSLDRLGFSFVSIVFPSALGDAQADPVGRPVTDADKGGLDEGFQKHGPMGVDALPVGKQQSKIVAQQVGGQVGDAHKREHQEAGVVDDPVKVALSSRAVPTDESIPAGHPPGCRTPGETGQQPASGQSQIFEMLAHGLAIIQVMVRGDQAVEQRLLGSTATYLHPFNRQPIVQGAFDRAGIDAAGFWMRPLAAWIECGPLAGRESDGSGTLQLEQKAAADDVFQSSVGLPPIPLTTQFDGDRTAATVPDLPCNRLDLGDLLLVNCMPAVRNNRLHGRFYGAERL